MKSTLRKRKTLCLPYVEVRGKWKSMWGENHRTELHDYTLFIFFNEVIKLKINDSREYLVVNK